MSVYADQIPKPMNRRDAIRTLATAAVAPSVLASLPAEEFPQERFRLILCDQSWDCNCNKCRIIRRYVAELIPKLLDDIREQFGDFSYETPFVYEKTGIDNYG